MPPRMEHGWNTDSTFWKVLGPEELRKMIRSEAAAILGGNGNVATDGTRMEHGKHVLEGNRAEYENEVGSDVAGDFLGTGYRVLGTGY